MIAETLAPALGVILEIMAPIVLGIGAVWAMGFAFKAFKAVLLEEAPPAKIEPAVTFNRPEVFEACSCPACEAGMGANETGADTAEP